MTNHETARPATVPPSMSRAAKAEALLLRFTAEAHRRKWNYDRGLDGDGVPVKSEAFDALHRLGEEMRVALEELRRMPAAVSVPSPAPQAADRRARYAAAIAEGFRAFDADTTSDAYLDAELLDAVVAAADAEEAELLAAVPVVPPAPRADDRAALDRVRALHQPIDGDGGPYCQTCTQDEEQPHPVGWWMPFPCPTVQVVDEELRRLADEARGAAEYSRALATPPSAEAAAYIRERLAEVGDDHSCAESGCFGEPGPCVAGEQQNETPEAETPTTTKPETTADRDTLRRQFGDVLRRWGLLDEQIDQKAAEEYAVTDLLALLPEQTSRDAEIEHLRDRLASCRERVGIAADKAIAAEDVVARARRARRRLTSALIAVEPLLTEPYPDDPRWTPWTRFVGPALKELSDALKTGPAANDEPPAAGVRQDGAQP